MGGGRLTSRAGVDPRAVRALADVAGDGARLVVLGLEQLDDAAWSILAGAGIELLRVWTLAAAVEALSDPGAHVVIGDAASGAALTAAVRGRSEIASTHVVLCAALESQGELRAALDAGADDVMRVPFEPEVVVARGDRRAARGAAARGGGAAALADLEHPWGGVSLRV